MQRGALLLALAGFLPWKAWAAPHTTQLTPQNAATQCTARAPCTQPTVDGWVPPLEYADGKKFPMQDYVNGGPNGELYLLVSDDASYGTSVCNTGTARAAGIPATVANPCVNQTLFIGLRLPRPKDANGNLLNPSGLVTVWLDANRDDTLNAVAGADLPRAEDRRIVLRYSTGPSGISSVTQSQGDGTGAWVASTSGAAWATTASVTLPAAEPGFVHIELSVKLRPTKSLTLVSEPLTASVRKMGLAIQSSPFAIAGATQKMGGGIFYNNKNRLPADNLPGTWETLEFKAPTPIPLSLSMWNVGQMPDVTFWVPDGGSGEIDTVAQQLFKKEVACVSEIWMSHERGELLEKVNALRAAELLPPMQAITEQNDELLRPSTESTGLVLLSSRQILEGGVHHFPSNFCTGMDCLQDKGVLWARIATPAATTPVLANDDSGAPHIASGTDYGEFVDVFCTHVNAGDNTPGNDTDAREKQFTDMAAYVHQVRQGGPLTANSGAYQLGDNDVFPTGTWPSGLDRPAFLMGDLNTVGPKATQADSGFAGYQRMMGSGQLNLSARTEFEKANSTFSKARDLARTASGADPMATGTWVSSQCTSDVATQLSTRDRIDYVLVFPPEDGPEFPSFALLKEPTASVDPHFDPDSVFYFPELGQTFSQCLSDHAMVDVNVTLARVRDVLKYNPARPHRVEYAVKQVTDLETASGCCADWYTPRVRMQSNGFWRENAYLNIMEDQIIYPNWFVHTGPDNPTQFPDLPSLFLGTASMTSAIWEEDVGPSDHYDSIPEGGAGTAVDERDAHFTFFASSGLFRRVKGEAQANDWLTPIETVANFQSGYEHGVTLETAGQDHATENNARVRHYFNVKELEAP
ncbi:hypothetical protein DRW03_03170 [Corallococcus sp. H22C18031201]|nr:hypothetical protein DRW03_03170 [Corallococcus sp. H22C18031201]